MLDGPMPRPPRDGCVNTALGMMLFIMLVFSIAWLVIAWNIPEPSKKLCQCGGDECPYTDNHVPKEPNTKAEMHYWSIQ